MCQGQNSDDVRLDDADREALREASELLERFANLNAHEIEDMGSYEYSRLAERAAFFAGRLAGFYGLRDQNWNRIPVPSYWDGVLYLENWALLP